MKAKKNKKIPLILIPLSGLLIIGSICWYLSKKPGRIRNVILISIDTCRADHLGCYGFHRPTTPVIDEIAAQGILFKRARTPVPLTLPAHCSMLTGTFPPYHQVRSNFDSKLNESHVTLAEILREKGFTTGAIISAYVLDKKFGTNQGFNNYQDQFGHLTDPDSPLERKAEQASQMAREFLTKHQKQPFFLFLHYFDPHDDYEPPEPFATRYADDLYSGEIAYTDQNIGKVIDHLKNLGLFDSTLLVIVGDHGEALGEHEESTHGYYIYQSTIHVPFIIRTPGMTKPRKVDQTVSLVDVVPTILGYLDIPIPEHIQGVDLSNYSQVQNSADSDREVYTESLMPTKYGCNPLLGVVSNRWSYIHTNHSELYDLQQDPLELNNLAQELNQRVRLMNSHLEEMVAQLPGAKSLDNQIELDAESRRRLESIGYVGDAAIDDTSVIDPSKKDPRDMQEYYEHRVKAGVLFGKKEYDQARSICVKMLARWPEMAASYLLMTEIAFQTKNPAEVIEYGRQYLVRKTQEIQADNLTDKTILEGSFIKTYDMMSRSAYELGKYDLVAEYCNQHLKLSPDNPQVMNVLATAYFKLGRQQQAFALWAKTLQLKHDLPEVYVSMGQAYYQLGEYNQAVDSWTKALQINPSLPGVRNNIVAVQKIKQLDQSIAQYTEMLRRKPDDPALHDQLAHAYYQTGKNEMAIKHWRLALQYKPDWPEAANNLAVVLATAAEQELRQPAEALQLALRAAELTRFENPVILETLSIAYFANNNIAEAITTAEKSLQLALKAGNKTLVEKIRKNIATFKSKRDG